MPISWNEIKTRAQKFSKEWEDAVREEADAKPFLIEFLDVFGISRKKVATFEHKVKKLNESDGYIDMLWKGYLLIEMKSRGKDLNKAYQQAKDYCQGLDEYDLPKMIIVSDFHHFQVYDELGNETKFVLPDLVKYVKVFGEIAGYQQRVFKEQDAVNIDAAMLMGKLHDKLKLTGYSGHALELYLVRLLFCLFADDTGIFEKDIFHDYLERKTNKDGSDLAAHLSQLFQVLNQHETKRLTALDESLAEFPYVNGKLFEEVLPVAAFDSSMRNILIECCRLDWGKISPAIFGSLFQSVMDEKERRNLGAHYTSEKNILKVIKPLFIDELWFEFESCKHDKKSLKKLHDKISKLRFLDPACGCGNFLIIAYRELRLLELQIIKILLKGQQVTSINDYFLVDVDQFYGIEYEEFPSQIAQVAMWLIDHQMNAEASSEFGEYYKRIPLKKSATILCGNALSIDWHEMIKPYPWEKHAKRFHFIFGNPPFIGKHLQNPEQKKDMEKAFGDLQSSGVLDYVSAWYLKSSEYLKNYQLIESELPRTVVAFVSTNSISQGEQVGVLWNQLFSKYNIKIHFAHKTFKWGNEAKGNAAVHVVIVGFSNFDISNKLIYEYEEISGEPHEIKVKNINPYLVEGKDFAITSRKKAICNVPEMLKGSQPTDGGYLLMDDQEKISYLKEEPQGKEFVKPLLSAKEFLQNQKRWCFWLVDASPSEIKKCPLLLEKIENVRKFRLQSTKAATVKWAATPYLFTENRQPNSKFILLPRHSSENRNYIPFGFFKPNNIVSDSCNSIPNASLFLFGILSSKMHNVWIKYVCGRIKSDYRYSNDIVYNNFPHPDKQNDKLQLGVEKAAQLVLDTRLDFSDSSLSDLYNPDLMPTQLLKAHYALDKAVDLCYRSQPFLNESKRIEFLFELYERYTLGMFYPEKTKAAKKVK